MIDGGLKPFIASLAEGHRLTREEARSVFTALMSGEATPSQIGAVLMALRIRGETVQEITGAVDVMRANMRRVQAPADAIDIVGTGGDQAGTYNVSTCASFVVAGCGVPVAKHGNRALSSKSGSSDVLSALGVDVDLPPEGISSVIASAGLGFMFAPNHHAAMRFVGPSRVELGTRTVFNLLGPLANPAGVERLLVGVFASRWTMPIAETLRELGTRRAFVVHGSGLDEMTVCGPTEIVSLDDGRIERFEIAPEDFGLARHAPSEIVGGDAAFNAAALRRVLEGEPGAYRDIVLLNAAGALVVSGRATTIPDGLELARASIQDGHALASLHRLVDAGARERKKLA